MWPYLYALRWFLSICVLSMYTYLLSPLWFLPYTGFAFIPIFGLALMRVVYKTTRYGEDSTITDLRRHWHAMKNARSAHDESTDVDLYQSSNQ